MAPGPSAPDGRRPRARRQRTAPILDPRFQTSIRPDAYQARVQPKDTFLTTTELAEDLTVWANQPGTSLPSTKRHPHEAHVYRWCRRDWFGALPEGRQGRGLGYRIPPKFRYIARLWLLTEDLPTRRLGLRAFTEGDARPWLLMVGKHVSTHYTEAEALNRISSVLLEAKNTQSVLKVLYVGPIID